ncbi:rhomboid family intramembrane serine protease [Chloroflexota bacterium]
MFPIGDRNPRRIIPWFTYLIIITNVIFFFFELTHGAEFIIRWSFIASRFIENPLTDFPTFLTSMFMHAGWLHIAGNMLYLWIFGDNIEERFGHFKFLAFYLACGLVSTLAQMIFNLDSGIPLLGASGAIAGVLGAYIIMFPLVPVRVLLGCFIAPLPTIMVIGVWIVLQFFYGVGSLGGVAEGGVAYMAHIGGFIAGLMFTIFVRLGGRRRV